MPGASPSFRRVGQNNFLAQACADSHGCTPPTTARWRKPVCRDALDDLCRNRMALDAGKPRR